MTTRRPTGYLSTGPIAPELIITRRIPHVIDAVWSQITDPVLLDTWYGTYAGDPATGSVELTTKEAPDHPGTVTIEHCEAPVAMAVLIASPAGEWAVSVQLSAIGDDTDLEFRQRLDGLDYSAADLGPGWEYYLDRLIISLDGGDVDALDWADYHPVLSAHYQQEQPEEPGQMPETN